MESLIATLNMYLPNLFPNPKQYPPIPLQEPRGKELNNTFIDHIQVQDNIV